LIVIKGKQMRTQKQKIEKVLFMGLMTAV
jgi:hypothetical protein